MTAGIKETGMHTKTQKRSRRSGSVLIVSLCLSLVVVGGAAIVYGYASQQSTLGTKSLRSRKAKIIAESGVNHSYNKLRGNMALKNAPDAFPQTALAGGAYNTTVQEVVSNRLWLGSVGTYQGMSAGAKVDLRYYPSLEYETETEGSAGPPLYGPYTVAHCLLVGGNVNWAGCGQFIEGSYAHADGVINLNGTADWAKATNGAFYVSSCAKVALDSASTILKATEIRAPVIYEKKAGTMLGTKVVGAVKAVAIPDIQLDPFYQRAAQNGQVYTNWSCDPVGTYAVPGGVLWSVGTMSIKGTVQGCFIATGEITINSGAVITPANAAWPTIATRDGRIKMTGQADITGLVYTYSAAGVDWQGGGNIRDGALVCKGPLYKGGNSGLIGFGLPPGGLTIIPPTTSAKQKTNTVAKLVITAWQ
jgi:hypothetical protein